MADFDSERYDYDCRHDDYIQDLIADDEAEREHVPKKRNMMFTVFATFQDLSDDDILEIADRILLLMKDNGAIDADCDWEDMGE